MPLLYAILTFALTIWGCPVSPSPGPDNLLSIRGHASFETCTQLNVRDPFSESALFMNLSVYFYFYFYFFLLALRVRAGSRGWRSWCAAEFRVRGSQKSHTSSLPLRKNASPRHEPRCVFLISRRQTLLPRKTLSSF